MENNEIKKWRGHVASALARMKHNRAYAQTEEAELCLAAAAAAWQEPRASEGKSFEPEELTAFLEKLAEFEPALKQQRPNEAKPIPELPVDPVTGLRAQNPWETNDLASQAACQKRFPLLAEHLQKVAKSGGFTFALAAKTLDEQAKRAQLKSIDYTSIHHQTNPFREGGDASLTARNVAQSRFAKENPPEVVEFYKREAQPLRPFWSKAVRNLTKLSEVLSRDPNTGALLRRAQAIEDGWLQGELASAKEAEAAARADYERALRLSGESKQVG